MSGPEPRFEVPPEYAEVYERAYRRAYEEGQGKLGSVLTETRTAPVRGKRAAIPQQRTRRTERARRPGLEEAAPVAPRRTPKHGRRADRRRGSTVLPLLGLLGLMGLMLVGAFILGRVTANVAPAQDSTGAGPGAAASATEGLTAPTTYDGPTRLARVAAVEAGCTARPGTDPAGGQVSYDAANTVDGNAETAWRCDGVAVGQVLTFTLAADTPIVQVGIVPGYARSDPSTGTDQYAAYNRVTKVAWILADGTTVTQDLGDDPLDRTERLIAVPRTVTGVVRLKILAVTRGHQDATLVSTVELFAPRSP